MKFLSLSVPGYNIQPPNAVPTGGLETGGAGQSFIQLGITLLFTIGIVLTVVFILVSGIQWITSSGDKEKIQKARARLTYSIIGLLVIVGSFFIISIVISLLGGRPSFFFNSSSSSSSNSNTSSSTFCADFCKDFPPYVVCPATSSQPCVCGSTDVRQCLK